MLPRMSTKPRHVNLLIFLQSVGLAIAPIMIILDTDRVGRHILLAFVNLLVLVYITYKMSQGSNWARTALLVLFLFGLPLYAVYIRAEFRLSATVAALSLGRTACEGYALFLAYTAPAKNWFKKPVEAAHA